MLAIKGREIPPPHQRLPVDLWLELRAWLLTHDIDAAPMLEWASNPGRAPANADDLAGEIVWIILCAGKSAQAARTIEAKVWAAIHAGQPVISAFGHRARASAIEKVWSERERLYSELSSLITDRLALLEWCRSIPWVGQITAFQLMKNFGVDIPKPDIWLCRLAGIPDRPAGHVETRFAACQALCQPLANASGDTVAAVDTLLWLACNKQVLTVSPDAGPVKFRPATISATPIAPENLLQTQQGELFI